MIVTSFLSPADLAGESVKNTWVVVVDVLRATSTIVTALHNGAKLVRPVADAAEAVRIAGEKRGEEILLAGEENGFKINGFDLGNSPLEYARSVIYGKKIILKTTNGTRAFLNVQSAPKILIGSFLNAQAAAGFLNQYQPERVLFVNSGLHGHFSLEDSVCSGYIISQLSEADIRNDDAFAAVELSRHFASDVRAMFDQSRHGRYLKRNGFKTDLEFCAQKNIFKDIPVFDTDKRGIVLAQMAG